METIENNKLIAEFMGVKTITIDELKSTLKQNRENGFIHTPQAHVVDDLKYHTEWNWLMPVIGKISDFCEEPQELDSLKYSLLSADIKTAYYQVVEFIKEFNNQN